MGGVTSTSWGLLIAFVLPGLVGLYGASLWSARIAKLFSNFLTINSSIGLFFLDLLAAIAVGLFIAALRWVLIDTSLRAVFKKKRVLFKIKIRNRVRSIKCPKLPPRFGPLYEQLVETNRLIVWRFFVDEQYRYYQWWGGFAIVLPVVLAGWIRYLYHSAGRGVLALASGGAVALEAFIIAKVVDSHIETVRIGQAILRGGESAGSQEEGHGEEVGEEGHGEEVDSQEEEG